MAGIKAIDWAKGKLVKRKNAKSWKEKAEMYKKMYRMKDIESDMWSKAIGQAFIHKKISREAYEAIHNMHRDMCNTVYENIGY